MSANPSYLQKLIQTIVDICTPVGTICNFGGACPTGWMIIDAVKVYEDEHNRLYNYLVVSPNLEKGADEDGRKWVKMVNPDGRVLQCTTSVSLVWKLLEACLPNISGQMFFIAGAVSNQTSASGAFDYTGRTGVKAGAVWFDSGTSNEDKIEFSLNRDNSAYAEGATVQQNALQVLVCIKF